MPKLRSSQLSLKASLVSASSVLAPTENKLFMPSVNPRIILRQFQAKEQCVWISAYDDDLKQDLFAVKIANCSDQQLPSEFCSYYLEEFEPFLLNTNSVCLRRCDAVDRLFGG